MDEGIGSRSTSRQPSALALAATVENGGGVRMFRDVTGYFRSRPRSR